MEKESWLQWRKIGSSDASAIMGVSPWTTPYQLWSQKVSGSENKENYAMARGKALEAKAVAWFQDKMAVSVDQQVCVEHKDYHFITATLDGLNSEKKMLIEVKCPREKTHKIAKDGKIPGCYQPQLQHQLEVMGYDHMFYVSFDGEDGIILDVEKDAKYSKKLVQEETAFWDRIINWDPPPLTDRDHASMEGDEMWQVLSSQWKEIIEKKKVIIEQEEQVRKAMLHVCSEKSSMGHGVKVSRVSVKGSVDYSEIPELKNVELDNHRKPSYEKWVFSSVK